MLLRAWPAYTAILNCQEGYQAQAGQAQKERKNT
jgi:hypothetical protein